MKQYIGTKIIQAKPMNRGEYNKYRGWEIPNNENPEDEGYLVKYEDGYESWSPKEVFEKAYRESYGLTFGIALELLKKGEKVARLGWNGKGMFLIMTEGSVVPTENMRNDAVRKYYEGNQEENVKICPHIDMKAADGTMVIGWLASQTDMLAEDWLIVN